MKITASQRDAVMAKLRDKYPGEAFYEVYSPLTPPECIRFDSQSYHAIYNPEQGTVIAFKKFEAITTEPSKWIPDVVRSAQ